MDKQAQCHHNYMLDCRFHAGFDCPDGSIGVEGKSSAEIPPRLQRAYLAHRASATQAADKREAQSSPCAEAGETIHKPGEGGRLRPKVYPVNYTLDPINRILLRGVFQTVTVCLLRSLSVWDWHKAELGDS